MNINQFIKNPLGDTTIISPACKAKKDELNLKYDKIKQKIYYHAYAYNNALYLYFSIPSMHDTKTHYDVILKFMPNKNTKTDIFYMPFMVASNCPSFIYKYAYAYNKNNLVIKNIQLEISKKSVKQAAKVTNPSNDINYEYSTYLAIKYMKDNNLINTDNLKHINKLLSIVPLLNNIQDFSKLTKKREDNTKVINVTHDEKNSLIKIMPRKNNSSQMIKPVKHPGIFSFAKHAHSAHIIKKR